MNHAQLLRWSLLSSLGLAQAACGGSTARDSGDMGPTPGNGAGGAATGGPPACTAPQLDPVSGLITCGEGYSHRPEALACSGGECATDADCGGGDLICRCWGSGTSAPGAGNCVHSACSSDAACAPGYRCASNSSLSGAPLYRTPLFACQAEGDRCSTDADCSELSGTGGGPPRCSWNPTDQHRQCHNECGNCGRPFLVGGQQRLAPVVRRSDWLLHPLT